MFLLYKGENCSLGELRLVGGQLATEGRIEVCVGGTWGTVCHDLWSYFDADVACGQLGFAKRELFLFTHTSIYTVEHVYSGYCLPAS